MEPSLDITSEGASLRLADLYEVFQRDPAVATIEARLRFRDLRPDEVAAARAAALEYQTRQQMNAISLREEAAANRAAAERASSYNATLASIGATPSLHLAPSGNFPSFPAGPGPDPNGFPRWTFNQMIINVIDGGGDPSPNSATRAQEAAIEYLLGSISGEDFLEHLVGAEARAQFHWSMQAFQQLGADIPAIQKFTKFTQCALRVTAASMIPRHRLDELRTRLVGSRPLARSFVHDDQPQPSNPSYVVLDRVCPRCGKVPDRYRVLHDGFYVCQACGCSSPPSFLDSRARARPSDQDDQSQPSNLSYAVVDLACPRCGKVPDRYRVLHDGFYVCQACGCFSPPP